MKELNRNQSLVHMWTAYITTIAAAIAIGWFLPVESTLWKAAIVDVIATLIIFGFSVRYNNSSLYDPYWSVAPIVFIGYWVTVTSQPVFPSRATLILVLVVLWGARLTKNFLKHWQGMHHEDWRYADFRQNMPRLYWLISFTGFHMVPTIIVFAASVPVWEALHQPESAGPLGPLDALATLVTLTAIIIEAVADKQMRAFIATGNADGTTFRGGLWRYSRHPNYFGEVLFWWGLFLFAIATDLSLWWTVFGPLAVTILFLVVSLPLIEARMKKRRSDYEQVTKEVSILIPWPPRSDQGGSTPRSA